MKRRHFIQRSAVAGLGLAIPGSQLLAGIPGDELVRITILHTNDTHSRIDPFPQDGSRNAGLGGVVRRSGLIESIRKAEEHVLLFDSGDIFQGTPYFNEFLGEVEIKAMNHMKYDAVTIGNHDFDGGMANMKQQMDLGEFEVITSNYDFSDTLFHENSKAYTVFERGGVRIGVTGVGIELDGLVPESLHEGTRYLDPVAKANRAAKQLREELNCHYVVCLSHLGYRYRNEKVSDVVLAQNSENIDLILGGHTHTFMEEPDIQMNKKGQSVIIHQCGWAGILLGRVDLIFQKGSKRYESKVSALKIT
jgi:5'-nucleotidase